MNILLRKEYENWFEYLGGVVMQLYNRDRTNVKGKNLMKAASKIGVYVNSLHLEHDLTERRLKFYMSENLKLRQEIEQLKKQLENDNTRKIKQNPS